MAEILCAAHLQVCAIRATRLLDDCTFATGPDNSVTTSAAIRFQVTPEVEEGTEILQRNGCGDICLNIKNDDEITRATAELELCTISVDLLNILTCKEPTLDAAGDIIGGCNRVGAIDCPGAFLEIWARIGRSTGDCGEVDDSQFQYVRYVYPRVKLNETGGRTFEDGLTNIVLTGTIEPNPNGLDGPFSDLVAPLESDVYECFQYETDLPEITACGYDPVPVPEDANTP